MIKDDKINNFHFAIPADLIKGKNSKGETRMLIKGRASTGHTDSEGESLDVSGFSLKNFKVINWNHAKTPDMIIGEPTKAVINKGNLDIEGELYSEMPQAVATYNLMKALKKRGRTLSLSVEGKILERGSNDEKNPLYNKIVKANITGVAVTATPINANTFCDLIEKGYTDNNDWQFEEDEEIQTLVKAIEGEEIEKGGVGSGRKVSMTKYGEVHGVLTSGKRFHSGNDNSKVSDEKEFDEKDHAELASIYNSHLEKPEIKNSKSKAYEKLEDKLVYHSAKSGDSLEKAMEAKVVKLTKSEIYEKIYDKVGEDITIEKAKSLYKLIEQTSTMEKGKKSDEITDETINKAFELLDIVKAKKDANEATSEDKKDDDNDDEKKEKDEMVEKAKAKCAVMKSAGKTEDDIKNALEKSFAPAIVLEAMKEGSSDTLKVGVDIEKSLSAAVEKITASFGEKFKAVGTLLKTSIKKSEALEEILETQIEENKLMKAELENISKTPGERKSINTKSYSDKFNDIKKGGEGKQTFNLKSKVDRNNLKQLVQEKSGISKGDGNYDTNLMRIAQDLELGALLSKGEADIQTLSGLGINLVAED